MAEFYEVQAKQGLTTIYGEVESATVFPKGTLVGKDAATGYIEKATAAHTKVAFAPSGTIDGETQTEISVGNEFILRGTADVNFGRIAHAFVDCDIVDNAGNLEIDLDSTTTEVLSIVRGTEGSSENVNFKIAKPLV